MCMADVFNRAPKGKYSETWDVGDPALSYSTACLYVLAWGKEIKWLKCGECEYPGLGYLLLENDKEIVLIRESPEPDQPISQIRLKVVN